MYAHTKSNNDSNYYYVSASTKFARVLHRMHSNDVTSSSNLPELKSKFEVINNIIIINLSSNSVIDSIIKINRNCYYCTVGMFSSAEVSFFPFHKEQEWKFYPRISNRCG